MLSVTAIVPTYHRPELLKRALRSIAAQEVPAGEVIVVDDEESGPTAATATAAGSFASLPIRVVANARRKGPSGARNTGAALASGDLLAFLDDDDEWPPPFLRAALALFASEGLDMTCADLWHVFDDGTERAGKSAPQSLVPGSFLTRNHGLIGSNVIIRRGRFAELGGFDESLPALEDMDFAVRAALLPGLRYAPLHDVQVRHHQHGGPRQCIPGAADMRTGVRRFYRLHWHTMSAEQQRDFREMVRYWWGLDEHGRIVGPPGRLATTEGRRPDLTEE